MQRLIRIILPEILLLFKFVEIIFLSKTKINRNVKPIFIIGSPRSGSTLIYQILTSYFELNYITNFISYFYHSLITGFKIQDLILKKDYKSNFKSYKGKTEGLKGPHEAGKFWRRWFPKNTDYVDNNYIKQRNFKSLLKTVSFLDGYINKPVIFKNTVNSLRLKVLNYLFPNSLIIICRRDPVQISYSILKFRKLINNDKNKWWAAKPKTFKQIRMLPYPEQIISQVLDIESQINEDIKLWPKKQVFNLDYESLCNKPKENIDSIQNFFRQNNINIVITDSFIPKLNSQSEAPDDKDITLLKAAFDKLKR